MTEDIQIKDIEDITKNNNFKLCVKENNIYINIPKEILEKETNLLTDYIRIYSNIESLKENINKYLFDENSTVTYSIIGNQLMKIKSEENLQKILPHINVDINKIEERLKNICACFSVQLQEINAMKEELANNYVNNSYNMDDIVHKDYVNEVIEHIKNASMYSLKAKSRYGSICSGYELKDKEDIIDFNDEEINGDYSPILVIYSPAKYHRGQYVLEDSSYVYIKRQPLEALIKQERLEEKGIDSMGAISYKKLKHDLTNENLQEILAEIYVYAQKNSIKFENIKLADINCNKVWMSADRLKKEFKELRYYHKNLTQKIKDIYDSTGQYYTQIGGKYIFNSREFMHSYKTYKSKDINN
ncbi:hypothetical protein [Romboutsia sp.]|uniref:hypothetical protein n=1 Tax=Romboutsia sp. TaxID=1965302 RepID=UPI002B696E67|nr:hypothetical protein [Romboutsia sp.]HSQ89751.1 hypothetical protein [Romboutsia sp.]